MMGTHYQCFYFDKINYVLNSCYICFTSSRDSKSYNLWLVKSYNSFPPDMQREYCIPGWRGNADHDPSLWWVFHFRVISPFPTRSSL